MKAFDMAKEKRKVQRQRPIHWVKICGYTVRWWEVPLVPFELLKDWRYNRMKWSDEKATKVLDAILPNELEWVEEDNAFYYCMNWDPHGIGRKAPRRYKNWANKFSWKLHDFIRDGYENPDYIKTYIDDGYEGWVKFEERA